MFEQQGNHIAYILREALQRGVTTVEPTPEAVEAWCTTVRETAVDNSNFQRECTPGYYNNEGEQMIKSHLGEPYWPGFYAMEDLLEAWRETSRLEGVLLDGEAHA
jgi:cyclohexanone monooxygenase